MRFKSKFLASAIYILTVVSVFGCGRAKTNSQCRETENDTIDVTTKFDIHPNFEEKCQDSVVRADSIASDILYAELEQAMRYETDEQYDGKIYTRMRQMPETMRRELMQSDGRREQVIIKTPDWNGIIREGYDSDKVSHQKVSDTLIYYEIARRLLIDVTSRLTGKNIKAEITREYVKKGSCERYEQFNLYGWTVTNIETDKIEIDLGITKLDSDVGDDIQIILTKEGKVLTSNRPIYLHMDDGADY